VWRRLETFYYITKAGGFNKAARLRNTSQPALTNTIQMLEHQLGYKVFKRKSKGIELTSKGKEVFKTAESMYLALEACKVNNDENKGVQGRIRISTTYAINDYMLEKPIEEFFNLYPDIRIESICNDELIDIYLNEVDVAIRPYDPHTPGLIQKHLFTLKPRLYASKAYLKKYGAPKSIADLDNHRLLTRAKPEKNPYSDVDWLLKIGREGKDNRKPFYSSNSSQNLFQLAENGVGIKVSYRGMINHDQSSHLVNILPNIKSPIYKFYLTYPEHIRHTEKIKAFDKHLMNYFAYLRDEQAEILPKKTKKEPQDNSF